ncbi:hypothetical protein Tco_0815415 [Tanacetum coccineum]
MGFTKCVYRSCISFPKICIIPNNDDVERNIDIEKTNEEEETDNEFVHGNEYVHGTKVPKTRKGKKEISDAAKADAEKTGEVKDDQVKDDSTQDNQATVFASTPQQHQLPQKSQVPTAVDKYLGSSLGDTLQKSFNKHLAYKALYHTLMKSLLVDEEGMDQGTVDLLKQKKRQHDDQDKDPSAGPNQGKKAKRRRTKDFESSKKSSASKGNTPPQTLKSDKPVHAEESVVEPTEEVIMDAVNENVFTQPLRPPTSDLEWNKGKKVDDGQEQTWFNDLLSAKKIPLTFEELMTTPIDFSNFAMNRLKIDKLTKENLVGPIYELLKGTCQSSIELEYNIEECYKALSDQLDWNKPEGDHCPFDLSKPLPLKGRPGYDKDALQGIKNWGPKRKVFYRSQLNRFSRHDVYSSMKILSVKSMTVNKLHGYGYLEEIEVRRDDRQLYKFKEAIPSSNGEVIVDLAVAMHIVHRVSIIKKRVEDVQLEMWKVTNRSSTSPSLKRTFLEFLPKNCTHNHLIHQKLTLNKFRDTLYHRLLNFQFGYNKDMPRRMWSATYKKRVGIMVDLIEKQILERRILRNLERLVGARELEMHYRLMQRTI